MSRCLRKEFKTQIQYTKNLTFDNLENLHIVVKTPRLLVKKKKKGLRPTPRKLTEE